jgi:hypothetical protein
MYLASRVWSMCSHDTEFDSGFNEAVGGKPCGFSHDDEADRYGDKAR